MESNDSPEIPDRGETSDILSLPSGVDRGEQFNRQYDGAYPRTFLMQCLILPHLTRINIHRMTSTVYLDAPKLDRPVK